MNDQIWLRKAIRADSYMLLSLPVMLLTEENLMSKSKNIRRVVRSDQYQTDLFIINRPFKPLHKVI